MKSVDWRLAEKITRDALATDVQWGMRTAALTRAWRRFDDLVTSLVLPIEETLLTPRRD